MSASQFSAGYTGVAPWVDVTEMPDWCDSRTAAYRIWMKFDGLAWWQRHEWKNKDGTTETQEWIRTPFAPDKRFRLAKEEQNG